MGSSFVGVLSLFTCRTLRVFLGSVILACALQNSALAVQLNVSASGELIRVLANFPTGERLRLHVNPEGELLWSWQINGEWQTDTNSGRLRAAPASPLAQGNSPLSETILYEVNAVDRVLLVGLEHTLLIFGPDQQHMLVPMPENVSVASLAELELDSETPTKPLVRWRNNEGLASAFALTLEPLSLALSDRRALDFIAAALRSGATPAAAQNLAPSLRRLQASFPLAEGTELLMDRLGSRPGIYLRFQDGREPQLISDARVINYPVFGEGNRPFEMGFSEMPLALPVVTEREILLVRPSGEVHKLPFNQARLDVMEIREGEIRDQYAQIRSSSFTFGEHQFQLISLEYKDDPNQADEINKLFNGETYLIADAGEPILIAYQSIPRSGTEPYASVTDSILKLRGINRQIDLLRLDGERTFQTRRVAPARDREGKLITDPLQRVESVFPDLVAQFRSGSRRAYERRAADAPLINHMRRALASREAGSGVILGPSGSGKTQIAEQFIAGIAAGEFPEIPRTTRVYRVDRTALSGGNMYSGSFEALVGAILAASASTPVILFADEVHSLAGSGAHSTSRTDFFNMVKSALNDGSLRIIGTSTSAEFYAAFGGDAAILRRLRTVQRSVMPREQVLEVIDSWAAHYRYPAISPEVRDFIYESSERYTAVGAQPAKSTALLDIAYAQHRVIAGSRTPLTRESVIEALIASGVDRRMFDANFARESLARVEREWHNFVLGQDAILAGLLHQQRERLNGTNDPNRPAITGIITGLYGTGKTHSVRTFAELAGLRLRLLNMAEFPDSQLENFQRTLVQAIREDAFTLFVPDELHLAGPKVQAFLLAIYNQGVVEMPDFVGENARQATGVTFVDFRNAGIVGTTNAGQEAVRELYARAGAPPLREPIGFSVGSPPANSAAAGASSGLAAMRAQRDANVRNQRLRLAIGNGGILPALVDRAVLVEAALPLDRELFRSVIAQQLAALLARFQRQHSLAIEIVNQAEFLDAATEVYFDPEAGNRIVARLLQTHIASELTQLIEARVSAPARILQVRFDAATAKIAVVNICENLAQGK